MNSPNGNQLSQAQPVFSIRVPKAHGQGTSVVSKHDPDVALRSFVTLAWLSNIIEVDDSALQMEIARARLQGAEVSFLVVIDGLWMQLAKSRMGMLSPTVQALAKDAPLGWMADCTSSAVKPSQFLFGEDVK